jgi:hypothetical protein
MAVWGTRSDAPFFLFERKDSMVKLSLPTKLRVDDVLAFLETLPFEIATFASIHPGWVRAGYEQPSLGGMHYPLGWACAFRGAGHDRLVSSRWLDHAGPWKLHRRGDLTLVQLHDLGADAETALAQAKPAHARMGYTDTGGWIAPHHRYEHDLGGVYLAKLATHRIIVAEREVTQREMLDACALRRERRHAAKDPIDQVGFVFTSREGAERHLRELWLRELECIAITDTGEVRLDDTYDPGRS